MVSSDERKRWDDGRLARTRALGTVRGAIVVALVVCGTLVAPELAQAQQRRVFVTSTMHTGNLGGLAGADAVCAARATLLGGTWVAWLSTSAIDAKDRLPANGGPWVRTGDGSKVADDIADLTDGTLDDEILNDETGIQPVGSDEVFTGTLANGTRAGTTCADWTSASGAVMATTGDSDEDDATWTVDGDLSACNDTLPIYCFEAIPPPPPGPPTVERTLTVSVVGMGRIDSDSSGIDCPGTCSGIFGSATTVTLKEHATTGWMFDRIEGDCTTPSGASAGVVAEVEMTTNKSCTATFVEVPPPPMDPVGNDCHVSNTCPPFNQNPDGSLSPGGAMFAASPANGTQTVDITTAAGDMIAIALMNKDASGQYRTTCATNLTFDPLIRLYCFQSAKNAKGQPDGGDYRAIAGPSNQSREAIRQALRTDRNHDGFPDGPVLASGTVGFLDFDGDSTTDVMVVTDSDPTVARVFVDFFNRMVPASLGSPATTCTTILDICVDGAD